MSSKLLPGTLIQEFSIFNDCEYFIQTFNIQIQNYQQPLLLLKEIKRSLKFNTRATSENKTYLRMFNLENNLWSFNVLFLRSREKPSHRRACTEARSLYQSEHECELSPVGIHGRRISWHRLAHFIINDLMKSFISESPARVNR